MRAKFIAGSEFSVLELEHWSLVGRMSTGELRILTNESLWQCARIGADTEPLKQAMADGINKALSRGPALIPINEEGMTRLAGPADALVREWMDEWVYT